MEEIFQDEESPSTQSNEHSSNLASTECMNLHAEGATMVDLNGDANDDVDENPNEGNEGYETRGNVGDDNRCRVGTSSRQGHHNSVDLACGVTPVLDAGHTRSISPQGSIHVAASSHNGKQKGRDTLSMGLEDEDAVRKAFLRSMKKGWGGNMKDERDKWHTNDEYRPVWVPKHLWPTLCAYWDYDEFQNLSESGKKNQASGERVSYIIGSVSFDVHEERMHCYVRSLRWQN
ncbi:hypothetical protein SLEP1_g24813 [Rubroshorea leprosula]|uniref:Uncharacterized protein n=1 Tax=Rubroshorea leprosula TaxID=152421 RepID=A0AAV5JSC2_9ROSI|nr:hypothetical protein SLEP1_g24813 [Rubroshorea leprosula]